MYAHNKESLLYYFAFYYRMCLNSSLLLQNFRDQLIDGAGLPLLTEEHLTSTMNMKLGPALKLRSVLAKKMGSCSVCLHCNHCHNSAGSPEPTNNTGSTSDSGGASWNLSSDCASMRNVLAVICEIQTTIKLPIALKIIVLFFQWRCIWFVGVYS